MSIRSLADFNGAVPRVRGRYLVRTDTVPPGGHPAVDHINAGTFAGHQRGLHDGR